MPFLRAAAQRLADHFPGVVDDIDEFAGAFGEVAEESDGDVVVLGVGEAMLGSLGMLADGGGMGVGGCIAGDGALPGGPAGAVCAKAGALIAMAAAAIIKV